MKNFTFVFFISTIALFSFVGCAKPKQVNYPKQITEKQSTIQSQCDIPIYPNFIPDNHNLATIQGLAVDGSTWVWLEGEQAYFWMTSEENKARAKALWENVKKTADEKYRAIQK